MANRITAWAIDCHDAGRLVEFWTAVLGWVVTESAMHSQFHTC